MTLLLRNASAFELCERLGDPSHPNVNAIETWRSLVLPASSPDAEVDAVPLADGRCIQVVVYERILWKAELRIDHLRFTCVSGGRRTEPVIPYDCIVPPQACRQIEMDGTVHVTHGLTHLQARLGNQLADARQWLSIQATQ